VLPENYINKARHVMSKHMFDQAALRKALWIACWSLFFASDHVYVHYYKSKWFPQTSDSVGDVMGTVTNLVEWFYSSGS
jgi:hypothetical protein